MTTYLAYENVEMELIEMELTVMKALFVNIPWNGFNNI